MSWPDVTPKTESGRAPGTYRTPEGGIEVIVGIEESTSYVEDMWPDEVALIRSEAASKAVAEVLDAAREVVRAYDYNIDAINGSVHEGPHDKDVHMDPCHGLGPEIEHVYDIVGDCAQCGGAQYGSEDRLQAAIVALKLATGEPLRPYEQHRAALIASERKP